MIKIFNTLKEAKIPVSESNLKSLQNLYNRYKFYGFNASEAMICNYIIAKYNHKKPNLKELLADLHNKKFAPIKKGQKVSRNALCPCGSKKKYKKCCWN